jgi:hypothetical protein
MAKLSAATEHAISVIAHVAMARGMSQNVEGMEGFYEFWLKSQTPKDREIIDHFHKLSTNARKDFAVMLSKDLKASNG